MKTNGKKKKKNQRAAMGYKNCVTDTGLNYNDPCPENE